jgi:Transposase DDE domain
MSKTIPATSRASTRRGRAARNTRTVLEFWHWFLPATFVPAAARHGNTRWEPKQLVIQAINWTWSNARSLTEAFDEATQTSQTLGVGPALSTYQGFMRALVGWSSKLIPCVLACFHQRMQDLGSRFWQVGDWVPIAFDGSRSTTPRTKSNETAYCAANYGKGRTAKYRKKKTKGLRRRKNKKNKTQPPKPQVWMTLMWHMGLRLPWSWRLGPSNASEREHVLTMLAEESFPKGTLFCGDAGFVGYPLWKAILGLGQDFLVRAGANVHLLLDGRAGSVVPRRKDQQILCWPLEAQRENQAPLRLRLIQARIKKTRVWLLTSVLDKTKLTQKQALTLYQLRWGIEVEFRGLKATLNRAELRCRNEARVREELNWSILGMAVAELWALKEQLAKRTQGIVRNARSKRRVRASVREYDPRQRSLAKTMRALRWCLRNLREEAGQDLADRLGTAVTDAYERQSSKKARYRPANPDKKPLGDPKLRALTAEEKEKLKSLQQPLAA